MVVVSSLRNSRVGRVKPFGTSMVGYSSYFPGPFPINLFLLKVSMLLLVIFLAFVLPVSLTQVS